MKNKNYVIILILFLLVASTGAAVFLMVKKDNQQIAVEPPIIDEQSAVIMEQVEPVAAESIGATSTAPAQVAQIEVKDAFEVINIPAGEKIKVEMVIKGVKFETAVKSNSSVYDLMNLLKTEDKIDFSGRNYSGLGFFVEEINGLKNNPSGENWIYYINGQPAQVGISNYVINSNDIIEWKYENKSF